MISFSINRPMVVNKSMLNIASRSKSLFLNKKLVKIKAKKLNKGKNKIKRYIISFVIYFTINYNMDFIKYKKTFSLMD